jgi:hypothetical protein
MMLYPNPARNSESFATGPSSKFFHFSADFVSCVTACNSFDYLYSTCIVPRKTEAVLTRSLEPVTDPDIMVKTPEHHKSENDAV